jgi:hypothetical protein
MTTVYSKNGICFLIPPASNYRCNGEVWCYCNIQNIISDLFPNLALACVTIRRPHPVFRLRKKAKFLSPTEIQSYIACFGSDSSYS